MGTPVPDRVLKAFEAAAPNGLVRAVMDVCVPLAVFPVHPDRRTVGAAAARFALYVRLHWLRMPPGMLVRHLARKFYVRHLRRSAPAGN